MDDDTMTLAYGGQSLPPLYRPSLAGMRYTHALLSATRHHAWIYDSADWASQADQEAWDKFRRDAAFSGAVENRRRLTASLSWQMQPRSAERQADVVTAAIMGDLVTDHLAYFWRARYHQTEAVFRGSAHQIVCWRRVNWAPPIDDAPELVWWVPTHTRPVDRWRLRQVRDDDGTGGAISMRWELYSVLRDAWEPLRHPRAWVHSHYSLEEDTLGYGRGLLSYLYWYFRAKEIALTNGLESVERWAQGVVTARVDQDIAGAPGTEAAAAQEAWLAELEALRSRNVLVYSKADEMQIHWPGGSGHQMVMDFVRYIDEAVTKHIEGSTQSSMQGHRGSSSGQAQATVHADEKDDYYAADRELQSEDWTRSLVKTAYELNRGALSIMCGMHGFRAIGACPHLSLSDEEVEDPQKVITQVGGLLQAGVPLTRAEVYERTGWSQPADGEPVFEGGGMGGGGLDSGLGLEA